MENEAGGQPSFAERKAAQLAAERAGSGEVNNRYEDESPKATRNRPEAISEEEAPAEALESADSLPEDGYLDDDDLDQDEDLDEEAPLAAEDQEEGVDWQRRYKDLEKKFSQVTGNRKAMEQEHADITAGNLRLKYDLEDSLTEAKKYADAYKRGFDQQISQLEQAFNQGMIEPDNLPAARQQYQALVQQRNQLNQQVEQIREQEKRAREQSRARQAELARIRLQRTIPNWGREKYQELGEYARSLGYSNEEFSENIDYRFLELLHDSMQLRRAGDRVQSVKRQKKAAAPSRNARPQPRSADGKFRKAQQEFRANPGQRGRFAAMKAAELAKERGR